MDLINFNGVDYPAFQSTGFAAQFAIPYALKVCKGIGYDIGCSKNEWKFPESIGIDPAIDDRFDAHNLPPQIVDYIFSSHCLEHVLKWVDALDHWTSRLKRGGVLFLYLPDYSQEYWRGWNNRKHYNMFTPEMIYDYMKAKGYKNIFCSGVDLNNSFMIMGELA